MCHILPNSMTSFSTIEATFHPSRLLPIHDLVLAVDAAKFRATAGYAGGILQRTSIVSWSTSSVTSVIVGDTKVPSQQTCLLTLPSRCHQFATPSCNCTSICHNASRRSRTSLVIRKGLTATLPESSTDKTQRSVWLPSSQHYRYHPIATDDVVCFWRWYSRGTL